jgi:hypothetical protein
MINDPYDKFPIPSGKKTLTSPAGGLLGKELKKAGFKSVGDSYNIARLSYKKDRFPKNRIFRLKNILK